MSTSRNRTPVKELEQKEIRGITFRLGWYILGSTATITATIMGTYFGLKADIRDTQNRNAVQDVQIQNVSARVDKLETDVHDMKQLTFYTQIQPVPHGTK